MILLYLTFLAVLFIWLCKITKSNFKYGIIAGLVFFVFCEDSLPWNLLPVKGIAFSFEIGMLFIVFIMFFRKKNKNIKMNNYLFLIVSLWVIMLFYFFISNSPDYGFSKCILFFVKAILPLFAFTCLAPFTDKEIKIIISTIVVGSILTVFTMFVFSNISERTSIGDINPITIARVLGFGGCLLTAILFTKKNKKIYETILFVIGIITIFYAMFLTGSRGPIFGIIFSMLFVILFFYKGIKKKIFVIILTFVVLSTIVFVIYYSPLKKLESITRITDRIITIGNNTSDRPRIARYILAWNNFIDSDLLGIGTGGFLSLYNEQGIEEQEYPHNVFLELAVEQGLIGVIILIFILVICITKFISISRIDETEFYYKAISSLWLFCFFNVLISGDIIANYTFWICGGLLWLLVPKDELKIPLMQDTNKYQNK